MLQLRNLFAVFVFHAIVQDGSCYAHNYFVHGNKKDATFEDVAEVSRSAEMLGGVVWRPT